MTVNSFLKLPPLFNFSDTSGSPDFCILVLQLKSRDFSLPALLHSSNKGLCLCGQMEGRERKAECNSEPLYLVQVVLTLPQSFRYLLATTNISALPLSCCLSTAVGLQLWYWGLPGNWNGTGRENHKKKNLGICLSPCFVGALLFTLNRKLVVSLKVS